MNEQSPYRSYRMSRSCFPKPHGSLFSSPSLASPFLSSSGTQQKRNSIRSSKSSPTQLPMTAPPGTGCLNIRKSIQRPGKSPGTVPVECRGLQKVLSKPSVKGIRGSVSMPRIPFADFLISYSNRHSKKRKEKRKIPYHLWRERRHGEDCSKASAEPVPYQKEFRRFYRAAEAPPTVQACAHNFTGYALTRIPSSTSPSSGDG